MVSGWYRSHRAVQRRVSPKRGNKHGKWSGKNIVLDGKSKENLEKICGIQFFFLVFLSFWTVCAYPKLKQQQKMRFRERLALFEQKKKRLRFWAMNWFGFGKAGSVFEDLWRFAGNFWENLEATSHPTLRKSARDFGKISHQFFVFDKN